MLFQSNIQVDENIFYYEKESLSKYRVLGVKMSEMT